MIRRADRVVFAGVDRNAGHAEIKIFPGSWEEHRAEEDGSGEGEGVGEEKVGGHICAIAVAKGNNLLVEKFGGLGEEFSEFLGSEGEVFVVELAFGESGKVAVRAVFSDLSSDSEIAMIGQGILDDLGEGVLVAAGTMEAEDDGV